MSELKAPEGFEYENNRGVPKTGQYYEFDGKVFKYPEAPYYGVPSHFCNFLRLREYVCSDGVTRVWDEFNERQPHVGEWWIHMEGYAAGPCKDDANMCHRAKRKILVPVAGEKDKRMTELKAPEGFEFTGDVRLPHIGEWFVFTNYDHPPIKLRDSTQVGSGIPVYILRLRHYHCDDGVTRVWDEKEERKPDRLEWFIANNGEAMSSWCGSNDMHNSGLRKILVPVAGERRRKWTI